MSSIKKTLEHYGLTKAQQRKPDWLGLANKFNFPHRGINQSTNKHSLAWKDFVVSTKNRLQQRYTYDTKIVDVRYKVPYVAKLKSGQVRERLYKGTIRTTRENINKDLRSEVRRILDNMEESDITIDSNFVPDILGEDEVPVELGGNGIRKVKGIKVARMRESRAYKLDNKYDDEIKFDLGQGTCCYDLLYYLYSPSMKRNMPDRETAYEGMADFFGRETLQTGLTVIDLERFCSNNDITIIALDKDENLVVYNKGKNKNRPALIFMISNNHIYPIFNKKKRESIVKKNQQGEKHHSNLYEEVKSVEKSHTVLSGDETPDMKAIGLIKSRNTIPSNVGYDASNNLDRLIYKDEVIHLNDPEPAVLEVCPDWKGETYVSIATQEWTSYLANKEVDMKSNLSPQAQEVFDLENVKNRAHYGTTLSDKEIREYLELVDGKSILEHKQESGAILCFDINKAYPYALSSPKNQFLNFCEEDCWEEFDLVIKNGLYAVETNDMTLLKGNNIYTGDILKLASCNGIRYKVLKQLIPKKLKPIPEDIFREFFTTILEKYGVKDITKLINNTLTGILGKTQSKSKYLKVDTDSEAVYRYLSESLNKHNNNNLILDRIGEGEDSINIYGYEVRNKLNEHTLPIYIQILDWANMELYNLTQLVGGKVLFRHTDCAVIDGGKIPENRMSSKWGDYKLENKVVRLESRVRTDNWVKFNFRDDEWNTYHISDSSESKKIIDLATEKGGLLIEGRAGTGKSYAIKKELGIFNGEEFVKLRDDTVAMSFTNKASNAIKGTTIHKALKISANTKINSKSLDRFKFVKYIVIDEIGMIPSYLWRLIVLIKQKYPSKIFILMGDFRQLPPVCEEDLDVFNHPIVKYLCNNNRIELNVPHRYNLPLWNFLEKGYESGEWGGLTRKEVSVDDIYNNKNICFKNETRVKINTMCMDHYKELTTSVYLPAPRKEDTIIYPYSQDVYLYTGLPVMARVNNNKLGIINSEELVVIDYDDEKIYMRRDSEDIEIGLNDFHTYFVPNYCATTHKSQGETYKCKVLLWDWWSLSNNDDTRLCYTACSRATDINNLIICVNEI
jgi:hypothetical protein